MDTVTLTIDGRQVTVEKGKTVLQAAIEQRDFRPLLLLPPRDRHRRLLPRLHRQDRKDAEAADVVLDRLHRRHGRQHADAGRRRGTSRACSSSFSSITRSTARCATKAASVRCRISRTRSGRTRAAWSFPRRIFDGDGVKGDVDFGPTLMLNRQRCILCTRCVRFMRDIDADAQINIIDRGYGSEIATFQEEGVHSLISGNLMDVCPVGAITTRDYRFKSRPWDNPNAADTICTQCEKGCNVTVWIKAKPEWAKGARLVRLTPRFNPDVNGYWMCDIGRFNYALD